MLFFRVDLFFAIFAEQLGPRKIDSAKINDAINTFIAYFREKKIPAHYELYV